MRTLRGVKKVLIAAVVLVVVVGGLLFVRAVRIHDKYGEWALTGTATPLRVSALGRDYKRGELDPRDTLPDDVEVYDEIENGGTVFVPTGLGDIAPVVIFVQDDNGDVWTYALVGGP